MGIFECPVSRAIKEPELINQMFLDGKVEKKGSKKLKSVDEAKKEMKSKTTNILQAFNGWSFLHDSSLVVVGY